MKAARPLQILSRPSDCYRAGAMWEGEGGNCSAARRRRACHGSSAGADGEEAGPSSGRRRRGQTGGITGLSAAACRPGVELWRRGERLRGTATVLRAGGAVRGDGGRAASGEW